MDEELWKPICNWPGYEVSNMGRVRSYKKRAQGGWVIADTPQTILSPYIPKKPPLHSRVMLHNDKPRFVSIRILVAEAFLGEKPKGTYTFTKDGNARNCRADNLVYLTKSEALTRLTEETVLDIRKRAAEGEMYTEIAEEYGLSDSTVRFCAIGKTYKSLPGPISPLHRQPRVGRFTNKQIRAIRQKCYRGEETQREIAKRLGVSESLISRIVNKQRYVYVEQR